MIPITSYALALYMAAAGHPCRGAELWPDGRVAYFFDEEAEGVKAAFFRLKETLDRARAEAELDEALARREKPRA